MAGAGEDQDANGSDKVRSVPVNSEENAVGSPQHSVQDEVGSPIGTPMQRRTNGEELIAENGSGDHSSRGTTAPTGINVGIGNVPPGGLAIPPRLVKPMGAALSPSKTFARIQEEREELSAMTPNPKEHHLRSRSITLPYIGEVTMGTLKGWAKEWLRNPKNIAFLIWIVAVVISGAILFMVMVGMLNAVLPKKADRDMCGSKFRTKSSTLFSSLWCSMSIQLESCI